MSWYSASLFFKATHDLESVPTRLWEERIVLVQANDDDEARLLAVRIGKDSEHEYVVQEPERHVLHWRFVAVESVHEILNDLDTGVELFSRLIGPQRAKILLEPPEDD
jgi:hypothetical protein